MEIMVERVLDEILMIVDGVDHRLSRECAKELAVSLKIAACTEGNM
jgi:hypothetical protein